MKQNDMLIKDLLKQQSVELMNNNDVVISNELLTLIQPKNCKLNENVYTFPKSKFEYMDKNVLSVSIVINGEDNL